MTRYERHGTRDIAYSNWHRHACPDDITMQDIDWLEYCRTCRAPLVLIEAAQDVGQWYKPTAVLDSLGRAAGVLSLCVLYTRTPAACLGETGRACARDGCTHGVGMFRVRQANGPFSVVSPAYFRDWLVKVHAVHEAVAHGR